MSENLTEEQIAEFRDAFILYDKDGDGQITIKELSEVLKILGQILTEQEIQAMIKQEGENEKAETIECQKFLDLMAKRLKDVDTEEELLAAFRVFDKDKIGKVQVAELRHEMTKLEDKLTDEEIDELIKELDIFGDGMINIEEMVKTIMQTK